MQNEIVVNASAAETRVAILERGNFVELHLERASDRGMVGNVVKGRVTRVLPGMQAAFVDIGLEKAAFLYAGDYIVDLDLVEDEPGEAEAPRRRGRRNGNGRSQPPKIESMLSEGEEVVVQVAKEPIGTKGARITSHVSIAGRHLVLTPWSPRVGVSRRIDSDRERRRLRRAVDRLRPRDLGFIIRTAGDGVREGDLEADVRYLTETWDDIQIRKDEVRAPAVLYREPSLPLRVVRDGVGPETKRIVVDQEATFEELQRFTSRFMVDPPRIERYRGEIPIFDDFGLEAQLDQNLGRKVWLKSGGYLIIDHSEALTAIDVNTGRYVGKRDLEETVLKTNLEAVKEVVHQLRFRNIGGLIIIDLIDMDDTSNREKVYRALQEALRQDKARTNILKISELGLVEMTRKRTRESLVQTVCEPCPYCEGKSYVLSGESVAYKVLRELRKDLRHLRGRKVVVAVGRRVGELLLGELRSSLEELEEALGRQLEIRIRAELHHEQFELLTEEPGPEVDFRPRWLAAPEAEPEPEATKAAEAEPEPEATKAAEAGDAEAGDAEPEAPADATAVLRVVSDEEPEPAPADLPAGDAPRAAGDEAPPTEVLRIPEPASLDAGPESSILPAPEKPEES